MSYVAIIAPLYGDEYDHFVPAWFDAIAALDRQPDEVILHRGEPLPGETGTCARLKNEAAALSAADWIWTLDVDDLALPDALTGIDDVDADVWAMGYTGVDGEFIPDVIPNDEYLRLPTQLYPAMSAFRHISFDSVGGFPQIAYEDWGLWRRMARAGCTFESSGRVHSIYRSHPLSRTATEYTHEARPAMLIEMMEDA